MTIDHERLAALACAGKTCEEIADELDLTPRQISQALYRLRCKGLDIPKLPQPSKIDEFVRREVDKQGYSAMPRRRRVKLEPFSSRLDADILARIKRVARRLEISQAVLVEDAVKHYLDLKGL